MDGYLKFAGMTGLWFMVLMLLEVTLRRGIGHIAKWTVGDNNTGPPENFEDKFSWQKGSPDRRPHEMEGLSCSFRK
jgi:hypothetical protein